MTYMGREKKKKDGGDGIKRRKREAEMPAGMFFSRKRAKMTFCKSFTTQTDRNTQAHARTHS